MRVKLRGKTAAGRKALVDYRDWRMVRRYRWYLVESKTASHRSGGPYAYTQPMVDGRRHTIYMHQLIMGRSGIDHRNGNGLDNRRKNLREATAAQNAQHQGKRPGGSSRYLGVSWDRAKSRWVAMVEANGSRQRKSFTDETEAARWRDQLATELHGEFAVLNFGERGPAHRGAAA